jgi:chitodextrinase
MMNKKQSIQHLDRSVIFLFVATFLVFGFVLLMKFINYSTCSEVVFDIKAQRFVVGELVQFEDKTKSAENWLWDFGDQASASSKEALHIYQNPGEYTIKLIVNDNCESSKSIVIEEKSAIIDSTKFPVFELPAKIRMGRTLYVEDQTKDASSWEWRFGETASANATTKKAQYSFTSPGLKTVSLIVNGDLNYITKKRIEVLPEVKNNASALNLDKDQNARKKSPKTVPFINEIEFANKLLLVSQGRMSPKQFSDYLCGDLNKQVIANEKNTTFLLFCEKIFDKKIKIKKIELFRDEGSNCIKTFTIDYRKSGLF